jgi:hypothetical protein
LVTSFIEEAVEMVDASVDDTLIASGIALIRSVWDAGLAHRDIKPSNLPVGAGKILIDVVFCQVRPSAWRQSVDPANMLMLLALGSEVDRVDRAALRWFTPDASRRPSPPPSRVHGPKSAARDGDGRPTASCEGVQPACAGSQSDRRAAVDSASHHDCRPGWCRPGRSDLRDLEPEAAGFRP